MKVVIGLSGGMDSTTLLATLLEQGMEVHCCSFLYGSKHNPYEFKAIESIIDCYKKMQYNVIHYAFDLRQVFQSFKSNLLIQGGEIPEGHYEEESMKKTVVPGRNTIFISIMTGLAQSIGANTIALGVHAGDHHIYPDCREDYIHSMNRSIILATENEVRLTAPFLRYDKTDILKLGYSLKPAVPYHLTRTCYKDQLFSCGRCGSCRERLEAFTNIGITDPVKYEEQ